MKILSKYKDYYDYIVGIYGEDPKIILDRRKGIHKERFSPNSVVTVHFCGQCYDFWYDGSNFLYGDQLKPLFSKSSWDNRKNHRYITHGKSYHLIEIVPYKSNCKHAVAWSYKNKPIVAEFPMLKMFDFHRIFSAKEAYLKLSEYLSPKEIISSVPNDIQKIESHGFDKKRSFRPKMK